MTMAATADVRKTAQRNKVTESHENANNLRMSVQLSMDCYLEYL